MKTKLLQLYNTNSSTNLQLKDVQFGIPFTRSNWEDNWAGVAISHFTPNVSESKGGELYYSRIRLSDLAGEFPTLQIPGKYRGSYLSEVCELLGTSWSLPTDPSDFKAGRLPDEDGQWTIEAEAHSLGYCGVGTFSIEYT